MSSLFIDTQVDMVELLLKPKAGGAAVSFAIGLDYWIGGSLYTSSPYVYPILARPPSLPRKVGVNIGVRQDVNVELYAKSHFQSYGIGFADLMTQYELVNSIVNFYYFPRARDAAVAADANSLRLSTTIIGYSSDDVSGIMTIQTREVWFNNKEIGKKIHDNVFTDIDPKWANEYGSFVFGELTDANGIIIDAPVIASSIASNIPVATLFSGWVTPNHPNDSKKSIHVRVQEKEEETREWIPLTLTSTPQNPTFGSAGLTENSNLSLRSLVANDWMMVYSPPTGGEILTAVRSRVRPITKAWAVKFDGSSDWVIGNGPAETWQANESEDFSFSIGGWVYLTAKGADMALACSHASSATNGRSWLLYFDNAADRFRFRTYNTAGSVLDTITLSTSLASPSTGTWYFIQGRLNGTGNTLKIRSGSGTWDSMATTGDPAQSRAGIRFGAIRLSKLLNLKLNGRLQAWSFHNDAIADATFNHYFNSGNGRLYADVSDSQKETLVAYWDFDDGLIGEYRDKHGSHDLKITGTPATDEGKIAVTIITQDGQLTCSIYHVKFKSVDSFAVEPVGSPIRQSVIDIQDAGVQAGTTIPTFQIHPPLLLSNAEKYGIVLSWSNNKKPSKDLLMNFVVSVGPTWPTHSRSTSEKENLGWKAQRDYQMDMELYTIGVGATNWSAGNADPNYATSQQSLAAKSITLTAGQSHQEFALDFEFKIGLEGLIDNGSGTYTTTAFLSIKNPASLMLFFLMDTSIGLGLTSSQVNVSSFTSLISSLDPVGFSLDRSTPIEQILVALARQSRTILYRQRDGKIAIRKPVCTLSGWTYTLTEADLRADLTMIALADDDDSNLVNVFKTLYAPDVFNQVKDPVFIRRAETDKYAGYSYIDETGATSSDARRIANCIASQALYGKREMTEPFDMYDLEAYIQKIQNYYADRYTFKQSKEVVRIPRSKYYNLIDLFTTIQSQHTGISAATGTGFDIRSFNGDYGITYFNEGVKCVPWAGGIISGEVTEIVEEGPFMIITIETMSAF